MDVRHLKLAGDLGAIYPVEMSIRSLADIEAAVAESNVVDSLLAMNMGRCTPLDDPLTVEIIDKLKNAVMKDVDALLTQKHNKVMGKVNYNRRALQVQYEQHIANTCTWSNGISDYVRGLDARISDLVGQQERFEKAHRQVMQTSLDQIAIYDDAIAKLYEDVKELQKMLKPRTRSTSAMSA